MKLSKISTRGDDKYAGIEPTWSNQQSTKSEMMSAFNWYNYFCTRKEAKTFVLEYMQVTSRPKEEISRISTIPDSQINLQVGWLARMMSLGYKPDEETTAFFQREFSEYLLKGQFNLANKVIEKPNVGQVINIQDRINEKASEESGELEGFIDDFILNGCKSKIDITNFMKSRQYSSVIAKKICDGFIGRAKEIEEVLLGNDDQLKEGYSNFTKPELKRLKDLLDTIVSESNRMTVANKPVRKKRSIKEKPATIVVARMKYMKEFSELKLTSVQPEKIVGAMQVWTYNTKTKLLGVYNADNAKGLTVKGSTLQNFNIESSIGKRLRKPEVVLPNLLNAGKVQIKKILPELTTKEIALAGRMNNETIIMRII